MPFVEQGPSLAGCLTFAAVLAGWLAFASTFLFRPRQPASGGGKRDPSSVVGIIVQGLGYGCVWGLRRSFFTPIAPVGPVGELFLSLLAVARVAASLGFVRAALVTLGKQWSLAARVRSDHALITAGPYRWVRHPIYTAMFGMLLATGLAQSHWIGLALGAVIFCAGTSIRTRSEERLLREAFGELYDDDARRVPAVFPWRLGRRA